MYSSLNISPPQTACLLQSNTYVHVTSSFTFVWNMNACEDFIRVSLIRQCMDVLLFNSIPNPMLYALCSAKIKTKQEVFLIPLLAFFGIVSWVSRLVGPVDGGGLPSIFPTRSSAGVGFVGPYDRHTWGSGLTFLCWCKALRLGPCWCRWWVYSCVTRATLRIRMPGRVFGQFALWQACTLSRGCGASGMYFVVSCRCRCERTSTASLRVVARKRCKLGVIPGAARLCRVPR